MARFYGTMTNRLGNDVTAENPGHAHTRGWKAGVDVVPSPGTDGRDVFKIYMTGGSGKAITDVLIGIVRDTADGPEFTPSSPEFTAKLRIIAERPAP